MPKPSPFPKHPVRVLRKHLGFTSAASFAEFVGVPPETIRNIESRHPLSDRVAKQICVATGIDPTWLRQGQIARGEPVGWNGEPLSADDFKKSHGLRAKISADPDDNDWPIWIGDLCAEATRVLRASVRKRKFDQCLYALRVTLDDAVKQLGLSAALNDERTPKTDAAYRVCLDEVEDFQLASRLLAPMAEFQWERELRECVPPDKSDLLEQVSVLAEGIQLSLTKQQRSKQSSATRP